MADDNFEIMTNPEFCQEYLTEYQQDLYFNIAQDCGFFNMNEFNIQVQDEDSATQNMLYMSRKSSIIVNMCIMMRDMEDMDNFRDWLQEYSQADLTNKRKVDPFWCLWMLVHPQFSDESEYDFAM
jgi:hypothetical protein